MDRLVQLDTAKLAHEKGFDKPSWDFITRQDEEESVLSFIGDTFEDKLELAKKYLFCYIPTQSSLRNWLWDVHKIWVEITLWGDGIGFSCMVKKQGKEEGENCPVVRMVEGVDIHSTDNPYTIIEKGLQKALNSIP